MSPEKIYLDSVLYLGPFMKEIPLEIDFPLAIRLNGRRKKEGGMFPPWNSAKLGKNSQK